jgi:hypothetical protein
MNSYRTTDLPFRGKTTCNDRKTYQTAAKPDLCSIRKYPGSHHRIIFPGEAIPPKPSLQAPFGRHLHKRKNPRCGDYTLTNVKSLGACPAWDLRPYKRRGFSARCGRKHRKKKQREEEWGCSLFPLFAGVSFTLLYKFILKQTNKAEKRTRRVLEAPIDHGLHKLAPGLERVSSGDGIVV